MWLIIVHMIASKSLMKPSNGRWQRRCLNLFNFTGEDPLKIMYLHYSPLSIHPGIHMPCHVALLPLKTPASMNQGINLSSLQHKTSPILANTSPSCHRKDEWHIVTITISPKKTTADLKKHKLKRRIPHQTFQNSRQNSLSKPPGNNPFLPPVVTSTCPALMTWSRSNSAHGTVTGTAKPYLGSPFICDPSWLGSFDGGDENCKNIMIISMRIELLGDFLNFSWVGLFLTDLLLLRVMFLRIISSWLTPVFSVSFLTKQKHQISAGETTQCSE